MQSIHKKSKVAHYRSDKNKSLQINLFLRVNISSKLAGTGECAIHKITHIFMIFSINYVIFTVTIRVTGTVEDNKNSREINFVIYSLI